MESTWPFVVIDHTRYMTTLIFAISLPYLMWRIWNALFDVREVASAARVSWLRWQAARRIRQEERLLKHYGRPIGSTESLRGASHRSHAHRESPCTTVRKTTTATPAAPARDSAGRWSPPPSVAVAAGRTLSQP